MPIHDWSRVSAGIFHDFHLAWISEIRTVLNGGLLPAGYYALAEQVASEYVPDLLTLSASVPTGNAFDSDDGNDGGLAVLTEPPKATLVEALDESIVLASRQRFVAIKHSSGDRTVAMIEVVSPGNKDGPAAVDAFVDKAMTLFQRRIHLVVLDVLPPTPAAPAGLHAAVWNQYNGRYTPDPAKPLTPSAYNARPQITCYVDPLAIGDPIPDLPLFLTESRYVNLPCEATYIAAYRGVPQRWKAVIEGLTEERPQGQSR